MRRGEIYAYEPVIPRAGQSRHRLIVSSDALHGDDVSVVLGIHLVHVDPDELLTPAVAGFYAPVLTLERVLVSRLREQVGAASDEEMDSVGSALKAALDLN